MNYKAVIFDLDGTLIHTKPEYIYKIIGDTLGDLGVISFTNEDIDKFWFETERDEIIKKHFGQEPELFWKTYTNYENAGLRQQFIKKYEDVDFVGNLRKKGYKTGIVTGSPERIVEMEVNSIGKENYDSVIIARSSTGIKAKPYPEGLEKCIESLGVKKHESLFIGNAEEDILAAKNAGILDVFLERGEYKFQMDRLRPSVIINSLYELETVLSF